MIVLKMAREWAVCAYSEGKPALVVLLYVGAEGVSV